MSRLIITLLLVSIGFTSCTKSNYSDYECEDFAMRGYKGVPPAAQKFTKYCKNRELKYTGALCQLAFNDMVIKGSKAKIVKKFGKRILNCFSDTQMRKSFK